MEDQFYRKEKRREKELDWLIFLTSDQERERLEEGDDDEGGERGKYDFFSFYFFVFKIWCPLINYSGYTFVGKLSFVRTIYDLV